MSIPPEKLTNRDLNIATGDRSDMVKPLDEVQPRGRIEPAYPHVGGPAVSLSTRHQPLRLVYRASIDHLSKILGIEGEEGERDELANEVELDPESTAAQILSFVNANFRQFRDRHPELGYPQQLTQYLAIVEDAITRGFEEARNILRALKIPEQQITASINRTTELIIQGLAAFHDAKSSEFSA